MCRFMIFVVAVAVAVSSCDCLPVLQKVLDNDTRLADEKTAAAVRKTLHQWNWADWKTKWDGYQWTWVPLGHVLFGNCCNGSGDPTTWPVWKRQPVEQI